MRDITNLVNTSDFFLEKEEDHEKLFCFYGYFGPARTGPIFFFLHDIPKHFRRFRKHILLFPAGIGGLLLISRMESFLRDLAYTYPYTSRLIQLGVGVISVMCILVGLAGIFSFLRDLNWDFLRQSKRKFLGQVVSCYMRVNCDGISLWFTPCGNPSNTQTKEYMCRWENIDRLEIPTEVIRHHKCLVIHNAADVSVTHIWLPVEKEAIVVDALNSFTPNRGSTEESPTIKAM